MFLRYLLIDYYIKKKILLIMDKKLNADLVDFFLKIPDTWDKLLINDTDRKKVKRKNLQKKKR